MWEHLGSDRLEKKTLQNLLVEFFVVMFGM